MKQLIIGPRLNRDGVTIGGSEVLFENWIDYCTRNNHPIDIIDGNKFNYSSKITALLSIVWNIAIKSRKNDIIFLHGSKNDYFFIAPVVCFFALLYRKPFFLKKFGGDFDTDYNRAPRWKKLGIRWALKRAKGLFWETKRLMPFGFKFNKNCEWSPNTRSASNISKDEIKKPLKYVFMSHVRKEKGIPELIEAFNLLGKGYELDIYGTLMGFKEEDLGGRYKGVVQSDNVLQTLSKYDVLILPSKKEGYPGIIIEAFSIGMPVIATNVGGIPEMISDGENGLLCEPHSAYDIVNAIKRLEKMDFKNLSRNAYKSFDAYDENKVNSMIIKVLSDSLSLQ